MTVATSSTSPLTRVLFLSDLDGTWLSKNKANTEKLNQGVQALKDEFRGRGIDFDWGYVTARPPERVACEKLPAPAWTITYNGGSIQHGGPGHYEGARFVVNASNPEWDKANAATHYDSDKVLDIVKDLLQQQKYSNLRFQTIGQVVNAPAADDCPFMDGICFDDTSVHLTPAESADNNHDGTPDVFEAATFHDPAQIDQLKADLAKRLDDAHVGYQLSPGYPCAGKPVVMFDATSPLADKGDAVSFVRQLEKLPADHFITAGDGGNDITMMRTADGHDDGRRVIVVGGLKELYDEAGKLKNAILQPAGMDCSLAVLDGLHRHLDAIARQMGK